MTDLYKWSRPSVDALMWTDDAVCRGIDTELFFPEKGGEAPMIVKRAKEICNSCPVQVECLEFALTIETAGAQRHGVWGGTTARERDRIRAQRREQVSA